MKRIMAVAGAALLAGCATALEPAAPAAGQARRAAGPAAFAVNLYTEVAGAGDGNVFISPASVSAAVALAYAGAKGETAREIREVFGFGAGEAFHRAEGLRLKSLAIDADGRRLALANALWFDEKTVLEEDYLGLVGEAYGAAPERADFRTAPEAARAEINRWAEARTEGRIKDLLLAGDLSADTRLLLVNAIRLKADWAQAFDPEVTAKGKFRLAGGARVEADFMGQLEFFPRLSRPGYEAILLPYAGGELSLAIFLPKGPGGMKAFERRLGAGDFGLRLEELAAADEVFTELWLPKTKIEARYDLKETLGALGVRLAFADGADFSAMVAPEKQTEDGGAGVKLGKVIHKTVLEMNEYGTEAAAASALEAVVVSGARIAVPRPLRIDRPFFLVIRHEATGTPVFVGRVMDPR